MPDHDRDPAPPPAMHPRDAADDMTPSTVSEEHDPHESDEDGSDEDTTPSEPPARDR